MCITIKYLTLLILLFFSNICNAQKRSLKDFRNCLTNINSEQPKIFRIKLKNIDSIRLFFFQDHSDTVEVYINDRLLYNELIQVDSTLVSSSFTGSYFSTKYSRNAKKITVVYINARKYLTFFSRKKYPLYSIHSLRNNNCIVAARRKPLILK